MKNPTFLNSILLMLLLMFFVSCSSDNNSSENQDNNPNGSEQFIKKIQKEIPESYEKPSQFFYENGKLTYVYFCSGGLFYFEYNNNDKISKQYGGSTSFNGDDFNPDTFDLITFKQNSLVLNYVYVGGRLTQMQYNDTFTDYHISYNNEGRVEVAEWILPVIGLWEKVVFTYSNGKISNINIKKFSTDGTLNNDHNYTFEYDDNPNPFYTLAENFSLLSFMTCTGFDYITSDDMALKLFTNNVKIARKDGQLLYSATYQYNDNNYPTRISYTYHNSGISGIELIDYN